MVHIFYRKTIFCDFHKVEFWLPNSFHISMYFLEKKLKIEFCLTRVVNIDTYK